MKRVRCIPALVLALILCVGLLPAIALADETEGDWSYTVAGGEAVVTGYSGEAINVTVPDTLGGCPVTAVGSRAFYGKTSIDYLTLPATVVTIGDEAFMGCSNLYDFTVPAATVSVGVRAFSGCPHLWTIRVADGNTAYASYSNSLYSADGAELIIVPAAKSGSFQVRDGVTTIAPYALYECENIGSVYLPESVVSVGENAFRESQTVLCTSGDWYYSLAGGEVTVTRYTGSSSAPVIPATLAGCPVTAIGSDAFSSKSISTLNIPEGVVTLEDRALANTSGLVTVSLPASITSIGEGVLKDNGYLASITVAAGNPAYKAENNALYTKDGTTLLRCAPASSGAFAVPAGVTAIAPYAFQWCDGLTELTLPAGLVSVGAYAFEGCTQLQALSIPASVTSLGEAFLKGVYKAALSVDDANPVYKAVDSVLYTRDGATLIAAGQLEGAFSVPAGVTAVGPFALAYQSDVTALTLPAGLVSIGEYAFFEMDGITEVDLPEGLVSMGQLALAYNALLRRVSIPSTLAEIPLRAFMDDYQLSELTIAEGVSVVRETAFSKCNGLTAVVLPESVTQVEGDAFYECADLKSVAIPGSASLESDAFNSCSALTDVYYTGTQSQWDTMTSSWSAENPLRAAQLHLVTPGAATVIRQPTPFMGASGDRFSFTVVACGSGLSYQWQVSTNDGASWGSTSLSGNKTPTLSGKLSASNSGRLYRCAVTDGGGSTVYSEAVLLKMVSLEGALNAPGTELTYTTSEREDKNGYHYYPWGITELDGRVCAVSGNKSIGDSDSLLSATVSVDFAANLSFWYQARGEVGNNWYDYGAFYVDGVRADGYIYGSPALQANNISEWTLFEMSLTAGDHTLTWRYRKDGSVDGAGDYFAVSEVSFEPVYISFSAQPQDVAGAIGETFGFSVEAVGEDLSYQWQVSTDGGSSWKNSSAAGCKTSVLGPIAVTEARFGYLYRCKVTDGGGHAAYSNAATLTEIPLTVVKQPNWFGGYLGDEAAFTVQARGSNLTYRWEQRPDPGDVWTDSAFSGADTATLTVPFTAENMALRFRCVLTDRSGATETTGSVGLNEYGPDVPKEQDLPAVTLCAVGQPFSVTAYARASLPAYQWQTWNGESWVSAALNGSTTATVSGVYAANLAGTQLRCVVTDRNGDFAVTSSTILTAPAALDKGANAPGGSLHFETGGTYPWAGYAGGFAACGNTGVDSSESIMTLNVTLVADTEISFDYKARGEGTSYDVGEFYVDGDRVFQIGANEDSWQHLDYAVSAGEHTFSWRFRKDGSQYGRGDVFIVKNVRFGEGAVAPSLAITAQPENFAGTIGSTASFTVIAEGEGLTYQWQSNTGSGWKNSGATGAKTATLSIAMTEARLAYAYRCVVTDAYGHTVTSDEVHMIKVAAAAITAQPVDYVGALGDTATFTVAATGDGLKYQWQFSNNGGAWKNSSSTGAKTATLSIGMTEARLGYAFRCVITDSSDNTVTSDTVKMVKAAALAITAQPVDYVGALGSTASFTVAAEGVGLKYQWQSNTGGGWKNSGATGAKTATLSIAMTEARLAYRYRCVITDSSESTVTSATVKMVKASLTITAQPVDYVGALGSTATFTVAASGDGLSYQWQFSNNGGAWKNSSSTGNKTATLSIGMTEARLGYAFRCVVTDSSDNTVTSATVKMVKAAVLAITAQPANYVGALGSTASFTVGATGDGLSYQWQFSNNGGAWKNSSSTGNKTATLSIGMTEARLGYAFRCVVTDSSDNTVTSATVKMYKSGALAITTQPVDYTGALGSTATFTVGAIGDGLSYQWQFSNNGGAWKNSSSTGNKTATLSIGMTEARLGYAFRCVVTDSSDNTVTSATARMIQT